MKTLRKSCASLLLISLFFLSQSCFKTTTANQATGSNANTSTANTGEPASDKPNDDMAELALLIRLQGNPDDVVWKEQERGDPKTKHLTAVLSYSSEEAQSIVNLVQKNRAVEKAEVGSQPWFPEELTAQSQLSGNETLKGTAYGANDFFNVPYGSGRIVRIDGTNYFVLELTAN